MVSRPFINANSVAMNTFPACPVIVLVTVNNNETHSLLDTFVGDGSAPEQVIKDGLTYNDLGIHGGCKIVHTVCEMGAGGIGASQQMTSKAIEHWQPSAVIAVGIAFGLDETKQAIGDVLVSTQIQDYELGRLSEDGTLAPRGDKPGSTGILRNRFRQTDINESRRTQDWPKVRFGLILSGQKLVDNLDYRESLKAVFTEAIGGEMEGVGLYVSASDAKVDWIVVKGICDWGHNKNQADKDGWQKLAAKNAARVLKAALDVEGLYLHSGQHNIANSVMIENYMPRATPSFVSTIRVTNIGKSPTKVAIDCFSSSTGAMLASGILPDEILPNVRKNFSSNAIESCLQIDIPQTERPRLKFTGISAPILVQHFLIDIRYGNLIESR